MAHPRATPRVKGPYAERGGTRFRIRICDALGQRDAYFSSLREAQAAKKKAERELPRKIHTPSLAEALDEYTHEKMHSGLCNTQSATQQRDRLRKWLTDCLDMEISKLTPKCAAALYEQLVATPTAKTGQPPTAATHRFYLRLMQSFSRWAVSKGYVCESPFAAVRPVGRVKRGKKQLRFEEAERFITVGFRLFEEGEDWMALAALTALLLGLRASEVLHLRVRDLDCGGTKLWVAASDSYGGKTANARRDVEVPRVLQSRLLKVAAGQAPDAYLFGTASSGKPRCRQVFYCTVHRVCDAAGVPRVCPHSLRGLWATAGVRSGAVSHAVAATLGHGSFEVTAKHYVQPGTLESSRTSRLVELLDLKNEPPAAAGKASADVTAEQLLASLPPETLAKLVELATKPF